MRIHFIACVFTNEELHNLYSSCQISSGKSSQGGRGMWHAWKRREKCTSFWWESPRERDHWEDQGVGGKMGSECILEKLVWGVWIGFDWLRTGTGGGLL
jgi:hypothetical protein